MLVAPPSWRLAVRNSGDALIVRLSGRSIYLHEDDAERLHEALLRLTESRLARGPGSNALRCLVVDLADVVFLTSSTVEVLLALRRQMREENGRLSVCNPTPAVRDIFDALQLDQIFDVHVLRKDEGFRKDEG